LASFFRVRAQRVEFRAIDTISFPAGKAGNVLRGAFGKLLWGSPDFAKLCAPKLGDGPSGLQDAPRPFVIRAAHLDGSVVEAGDKLCFDVHTFDLSAPVADLFLNLDYAKGRIEALGAGEPVVHTIDLAVGQAASGITMEFRTPVDLKGNSSRKEIPFGVLFARARDRIGTLSGLYGEGPLDIDYAAMGVRAFAVRTVKCEVQYRDVSRRSGRTGDVHPIGGFTGTAEYEGALTEFVPFLEAAFWTGVGRHTVWGNGVIDCVRRR